MSEHRVSWRAPGRVNLIGEHTDYNEGFVLPLAIDQSCTATVTIGSNGLLQMSSAQANKPARCSVASLAPGAVRGWAPYVAGVIWALRESGYLPDVPPLTIHVDSDVPTGAGLSSSHALECAVATAVNDLLSLGIPLKSLVPVVRKAENEFVGAPTGDMDQTASLLCQAHHALFCDMRDLSTENVPFSLADNGLALLVVDSKAKHSNTSGEYGERRASCEEAAKILGVRALRDVTDLHDALRRLPNDRLRKRVRHIVTENDRVLRTVSLLRQGLIREIGPLLTESHASMRDDYEITVPEVNTAVEALLGAGAYGARMTGGGFGGCVIALLDEPQVAEAAKAVAEAYAKRGFGEPSAFVAHAGPGAHRVTDSAAQ